MVNAGQFNRIDRRENVVVIVQILLDLHRGKFLQLFTMGRMLPQHVLVYVTTVRELVTANRTAELRSFATLITHMSLQIIFAIVAARALRAREGFL